MTPVDSEQREQRDRDDAVGPGSGPRPYSTDEQQFGGARECGQHAEQESCPYRPDTGPGPECVARPPVKHVSAECAEGQGDRKRDAHRVDRMPKDRNLRLRFIEAGPLRYRIDQLLISFPGAFFRHWSRLLKTIAMAITPAVLVGCKGALSIVDPAGPAADDIATLWWVMLVGSAMIFGLVMGLLVAAFV